MVIKDKIDTVSTANRNELPERGKNEDSNVFHEVRGEVRAVEANREADGITLRLFGNDGRIHHVAFP